MKEYLQKFSNRNLPEPEDFKEALRYIMDGKANESETGAFLLSTTLLDRDPKFIHACAETLYERSKRLKSRHENVIDVCGTGGDYSGTFNISTAVALLIASAEIPVAKHGNRSISSKSGSADVLEALKIPINLKPEESISMLDEKYFTFLFAPQYHSSMKHLGASRKNLGIRTMFNIIGPLVNPFYINSQMIGIAEPSYAEPILEVAKMLGRENVAVAHGYPLDELSLHNSKSSLFVLKNGKAKEIKIDSKSTGLKSFDLSDIAGDDANHNAQIIRDIAENKETGPKRDVVTLNAGAAFFIAGRTDNLKQGIELAQDLIEKGKLMDKIQEVSMKN